MKLINSLMSLLILIISCNGQNTLKPVRISPLYDPYGDIIYCGLMDKSGNLWFAASDRGVYRYDGKSFTNITSKEDFTTKDSLAYSVRIIVEDKTGNIWFGSRGGLLYRYDGKSFTDFSQNVSKK